MRQAAWAAQGFHLPSASIWSEKGGGGRREQEEERGEGGGGGGGRRVDFETPQTARVAVGLAFSTFEIATWTFSEVQCKK